MNTQAALSASEQMAADGLRVIALAYAECAAPAPGEESQLRELTLVGLVGIKDRLRSGVPAAVQACQRAGVTVRMVTGDNGVTAASIARECGVLARDAPAAALLDGSEFRAMSDEQVCLRLPQLRVMARSTPADKHRLVRLLKGEGEVVAVTGDGTNDAPALSEVRTPSAMRASTQTLAQRWSQHRFTYLSVCRRMSGSAWAVAPASPRRRRRSFYWTTASPPSVRPLRSSLC